ncbi:MFS transporter [Streptomyces sp. AS58]|uniref:MFS transporter n=1 Tax=Streptomyces sp. AS58 TaxID=1519489 RepID=UPI00099DA963|nr:MFS transporter [Streptomyces sp. AS58]
MRSPRQSAPHRLPRQFHAVWAAVTVSSIGDGMRAVTLPLLTAHLTDDARLVGLVAFAGQIPWLLVSLPSGVLADRFERRRLLCFVDTARAVIMTGLMLLAMLDGLSIPLLAGAAFLLGCGQTLFNGAWSGMVPSLVPPEGLTKANTYLQITVLFASPLLGTPLGAVLFGVTPALPLAVDALSFVCAAGLILLLTGGTQAGSQKSVPTRQSLRQDALQGLVWLWRHSQMRRLCAVSAVNNLVVVGLMSVLVLYAQQTLELENSGYAVLVAAFAVGGLIGVPLAPRLEKRIGAVRLLRLGILATGVLCAGMGMARSVLVGVLIIAGYGAVSLVWGVTAVSLRQSQVPAELLGRVTMAFQMASVSAGALGALLAGLVYHSIGPQAPFFTGAALLCLAGALLYRAPTPHPASSNGHAHARPMSQTPPD